MPLFEGNENDNALGDTGGNDTLRGFAGNDTLTVTDGVDFADGGAGDDILRIRYGGASQTVAIFNGAAGTYAYEHTGGDTSFFNSTRSVDFQGIEHIDAVTGSGDDHIIGVSNSTDTINGGGGTDRWTDSFSGAPALDVRMAQIASGGQTLADGSRISNVEAANIDMSGAGDRFRDAGRHDDRVFGAAGDDDIGVSNGVDFVDGGAGDDILTMDYSAARQRVALFTGAAGTYAYEHTGGDPDFSDSTRSVDFQGIEHIRATTGRGDDLLYGVSNSTDTLDGGRGTDEWRDSFSAIAMPLDVQMAQISSSGGQTLADGSRISNIEIANIGLTGMGDTFRDAGAYNDRVFGDNGDDDIGVSNGVDFVDGGAGDDILTIDWAAAAERVALFTGAAGTYGYEYTDGDSSFSNSTRSVDFQGIEHIDIVSGAGHDLLYGVANQWDKIDGGDGTDEWRDSFSAFERSIVVKMAKISKDRGQTLRDSSEISNIEAANIGLSGNDDTFVDKGAYNDRVFGDAGDDLLAVSNGVDFIDGGSGADKLKINWKSAEETVQVFSGASGTYAFEHTDGDTSFSNSTRSVDYQGIEHMIVNTGAGDDRIMGTSNAWDKIKAGGGTDTWIDSFSALESGLNIQMKKVASNKGQKFSDKTVVAQVEQADLGLTAQNDKFRDRGAYDDRIFANAGNDTIGTSNGRDFVDGGEGDDTLVISWGKVRDDATIFNSSSGTYGFVDTAGTGSFSDSTRSVDFQAIERIVAKTGGGDDRIGLGGGDDVVKTKGGDDRIDAGGGDDMISGGGGADTFVLGPGSGTDTIRDFAVGTDLIDLVGGLRFSDLSIGGGGNATITVDDTGEVLAVLRGVSAGSLDADSFV